MAKQDEPAAIVAADSARSRDREERSRDDAGLPVSSLREAAPYLRRPFTPEAVKFKVQSVFKDAKGCLIAPYIDARLVVERLNRVVPDMWTARYEPIDGTRLAWCHLSIQQYRDLDFDGPRAVTRSDVGESPKGMSKDLVSDSLKRAAVHFGVGVSIYALPQIVWYADKAGPNLQQKSTQKGPTLVLTEAGHASLRESYAAWLEKHGVGRFGEPLDHGDVEGATFDDSEPELEDDFAPEPPAALDDEEARGMVASIRGMYEKISALGDDARRELPPARFNAWLTGAQHSHVELARLEAHLGDRLAALTAKYGAAS